MNSLVCIFYFLVWLFALRTCFLCLPCVPLSSQMSSNNYVGFSDGAYHSTQNLSSTAWGLFTPDGELINFQGIFLGWTSKNIVNYSAVIELLSEEVSLRIRNLVVNLDSQLVVLQLNGHYSVRNPQILHMYLHVQLLERNLDYTTC